MARLGRAGRLAVVIVIRRIDAVAWDTSFSISSMTLY